MTVVESAVWQSKDRSQAGFTKSVKMWDKNEALKELYCYVFLDNLPKALPPMDNQYGSC